MASSTMQLPTVTSRGAERRLKRQRHTQGGRRLDSGGSDGADQATEAEQHEAAAHRDEPRSVKVAEDAAGLAERPAPRQRQKPLR